MYAIRHRVGIKAAPEKVYELLTTDSGLEGWWTSDVSGAGDVGSTIKFRFNGGGPDFKVSELMPNKRVRWQHSSSGPEEWKGTEIVFELEDDGEQTMVDFAHANWQAPTNLLAGCSTKWAVFMLSLKEFAETGKGKPFPEDIQINHS